MKVVLCSIMHMLLRYQCSIMHMLLRYQCSIMHMLLRYQNLFLLLLLCTVPPCAVCGPGPRQASTSAAPREYIFFSFLKEGFCFHDII